MKTTIILLAALLTACGGKSNSVTIVTNTGGSAGSSASSRASAGGVGGTIDEAAGAGGFTEAGAGGETPAPYDGPPVIMDVAPGHLRAQGIECELVDFTFGVQATFYGSDYPLRVIDLVIGDRHVEFGYGPGYESRVDGLAAETLVTKWDPDNLPEGSVSREDTLDIGVYRLHGSELVEVEDIFEAWIACDGKTLASWPAPLLRVRKPGRGREN